MCNKEFHIWFPKAMVCAMEVGTEKVDKDVRALMLPPFDGAKSSIPYMHLETTLSEALRNS